MMRSWDALPERPLAATGLHSDALLQRGVRDFRAAGAYLQRLPYGRNRDRSDFRTVLEEQRGTCSTKHALLATVALEQALAIDLVVGIYDLCEANTPGVGAVLEAAGLSSLPEAHCYVKHAGDRIDVTRAGVEPATGIQHFHEEWKIAPDQIGDHKVALHRRYLSRWLAQDAHRATALDGLEGVWRVRERCIAALAG